MIVSAILWLFPVSEGVYDFRTNTREITVEVTTAIAETTADIVLTQPLYDDDIDLATVFSDLGTDTPTVTDYDDVTRELEISGLDDDETRNLTITYPYDCLSLNVALNTVMDIIPVIWILILVGFPAVSLIVIWQGRA